MEMKSTPEQFQSGATMADILAEGHSAILSLRKLESSDEDINYITAQGLSAFTDAVAHIERIDELPQPDDATTVLIGSFVDGFFGNVEGGYNRGKEAEEKQSAINEELQPLLAALAKGSAAQLLLPKVAEKFSATFCDSSSRIFVDFDEAWGPFGPFDQLSMNNDGPALEDCTIIVQLTGANGEIRKNVHFVKQWPARSWLGARYHPGETVLGRTTGRTSVALVKQVDITVMSPQFATLIRYLYSDGEREKDIAEICQNIRISGRYQPFQTGFLGNTQRGAVLVLDGVTFIPACDVNLTFRNAVQTRSFRWKIDSWKNGERKQFNTAEGQLTFEPHTIDIALAFLGTSYKFKISLPVR
ncbi:MAG TPA: hypothetical protein VGM05_11555 [Planctomycetaceae bacterium]|jgi:hypothetical protein